MKRARILLDLPAEEEKAWCWRDEWVTGFDSVYGLMSKFARLNALDAHDLAQLFIDPKSERRTAIIRAPKVDLRFSDLFDVNEIKRHMRLDSEDASYAFVFAQTTKRLHRSSDSLRWCPRCAFAGFHSPLFQLSLLGACPAHGQTIRSHCPKCRSTIPYRLQLNVFAEPFCCSSCGYDLAPTLRATKTRSFTMREHETAWIPDTVALLSFEDRVLPIKTDPMRQRALLLIEDYERSAADVRVIDSEFDGFVAQVLSTLKERSTQDQMPFAFNRISVTQKGAQKSADDRQGRLVPPQAPKFQPSSYFKKDWAPRLYAAYQPYAGVRRHLWRHVVHEHQHCIASAGKHIWWNMEKFRTPSFCPIAEAFLRWRMFWEGTWRPADLFSWAHKDPFGLMIWLEDGTPLCPKDWPWDAEQWVSHHVLSRTCLGSFGEFSDLALQDWDRDLIEWIPRPLVGGYESYWAVSGEDTPASPLQFHSQLRTPYRFRELVEKHRCDRAHRLEHHLRLERVRP